VCHVALMAPFCCQRWALCAFHLLQLWHVASNGDFLEDDDRPAVERLRHDINALAQNSTSMGIILVTGPRELQWSSITVPIWREYCANHEFGFLLQQEPLSTDLSFEWAKPRVLMELLPKTRWKYVLMVDGSSLPVKLSKSWAYAIKRHMRHKRHDSDKAGNRLVFCPWDCEKEYDDAYADGACYGPLLSGCIFWSKKSKTLELAKTWYDGRREDKSDRALVKAFQKMKDRHWDQVYYKDIQQEMGRSDSNFLASFSFDAKYGWNVRDQIHDYVADHPELAQIANKVKSGRLSSAEL